MKLKQLTLFFILLAGVCTSVSAAICQDCLGGPCFYPSNGNWFVSAGLGINFLSLSKKHNYLPDFPGYPDDYIQSSMNDQTVVALAGGYRWDTSYIWLPHFSLGVEYNYMTEAKAKGSVDLYSLPAYNNYDYSYEVSTQSLLLFGKADIYYWHSFMPYILVGGGMATNKVSNYKENALAGVTLPRVSPAFGNATETNIAYAIGMGVDYAPLTNLWFTLGYSYNDYGQIKTGKAGVNNSNAGSKLKNTLTANNLMFSVSYFFNG